MGYRLVKLKVAETRDTASRQDFHCWILEEWRREAIPQWRRVFEEAQATGHIQRADYAKWILQEILHADDE